MRILILLPLLSASILIGCHGEDSPLEKAMHNYLSGDNSSTNKRSLTEGFWNASAQTRTTMINNSAYISSKPSSGFLNLAGQNLAERAAVGVVSVLLPKMIDSALDLGVWSFKLVKSSINELNAPNEEERNIHSQERAVIIGNINNSVLDLNSISPVNNDEDALDNLDEDDLKMLAEKEVRTGKTSTYFRIAYRNYLSRHGKLDQYIG